MTTHHSTTIGWMAAFVLSAGCSSAGSTASSNSGGENARGGASGVGASNGGATWVVGGSYAGGTAVQGGKAAQGGSATGDTSTVGGGLARGGAAAGGTSSNTSSGSTTSNGGTSGHVGGVASSVGGTTATGGRSAGGGASSGGAANGGTKPAGGAAAGGGKATGGAPVGGMSPSGGVGNGGASASGGVVSCPVAGATSTTLPTLNVQLSNQYRAVTHAASGSLYGLANDGSPPDSLIGPLAPSMFTQMPPNGQQLGNGATSPTGDTLKVAAPAARAGATITIRMPDTYPNFPYQWVSWTDWYNRVDAMVTATLNSGITNLYAYEIWNEPNWTWNNPNNSGTAFNEAWKNTYQRIKSKDAKAKILGPSISCWDSAFMQSFLSYAKTNGCLPDIVCWHELGEPEGSHVDTPRPGYIPDHVAAYRAMETSLGITKRPISINEYGIMTEEGIPGSMIRYIAHFERLGIETANIAYWHQSGRLSDLLTSIRVANGGWWFYKFYGDMSGAMAMTTPPAVAKTALGLDGIASLDAAAKNVQVVFGGASGNNAIVIQGFASAPFFACTAHVKAESTPWNGVDSAVAAPTTLFEANYPISNGQIIVPINGMNATSGYRLVITPG